MTKTIEKPELIKLTVEEAELVYKTLGICTIMDEGIPRCEVECEDYCN